MANGQRSDPGSGGGRIPDRRSAGHPRQSPKLGDRTIHSKPLCRRCTIRFSETTPTSPKTCEETCIIQTIKDFKYAAPFEPFNLELVAVKDCISSLGLARHLHAGHHALTLNLCGGSFDVDLVMSGPAKFVAFVVRRIVKLNQIINPKTVAGLNGSLDKSFVFTFQIDHSRLQVFDLNCFHIVMIFISRRSFSPNLFSAVSAPKPRAG